MWMSKVPRRPSRRLLDRQRWPPRAGRPARATAARRCPRHPSRAARGSTARRDAARGCGGPGRSVAAARRSPRGCRRRARPWSARWSSSSISRSIELCQQEIADQDLVDERRHQVAGRQLPEPGLAVEPSSKRSRAATGPRWTVRTTLGAATRSISRRTRRGPSVSSASIASSVMWRRSAVRVRRARPRRARRRSTSMSLETERPRRSRRSPLVVAAVDVDPQQPLRPEGPDDVVGSARLDGRVRRASNRRADGPLSG